MNHDPVEHGSDRNLCRACGLRFSTTWNFDRHRVGNYDNAAPNYGRRCLSETELRARGLSPDAAGYWRRRPPAALAGPSLKAA